MVLKGNERKYQTILYVKIDKSELIDKNCNLFNKIVLFFANMKYNTVKEDRKWRTIS